MRSWLIRRFEGRGEAGLTLIEVLVAAVILVMGAMATFGILSTATKNAQRAKASQVALNLAQEEMERLRSLPFASLGLNTTPTKATSDLNPNYRISGSTFALKRNPVSEPMPLVIDANGISPESGYTSGNVEGGSGTTGTIFRYVVCRNDDGATPKTDCTGENDYKQLVVAVKPDAYAGGGERGYVEVQSEFIDPKQLPEPPPPDEEEGEDEGGPDPEEEEGATAQQFFLSDTACAKTGTTARVTIAGDHLLHNTLGTCEKGLQSGSVEGAPDALLLSAPPDPAPEDEFNPLLYDYADDFYLEPTPDTDKGLQVRRGDTSGCHYQPSGSSNPESQVHRWVTDSFATPFVMTEKATLEISTRTLNDALHTGTLCVFLFKREESGSPKKPTDTMLTDKTTGSAYWTYTPEGNGFWPRFTWSKVRLTMLFNGAPYTIPAGSRLGVGIGVERANTPADAIPIMYDHPNYPTRIEIDTDDPIEG